jgi:hypothetical protein
VQTLEPGSQIGQPSIDGIWVTFLSSRKLVFEGEVSFGKSLTIVSLLWCVFLPDENVLKE